MTPMVVQCAACRTDFELDPRKVPERGVRARCSVCAAVIAVPPPPRPATAGVHASREATAGAGELAGGDVQIPAPAAAVYGETPPAAAATAAESWRSVEAPPPAPGPAPEPSPAAAAPASPPAGAAPAPDARRPINPFLARDPGLRAKRLARALVSDIVAYHPARHAEGLRDGTLKQLFRDEIKKSYEEYVEQVGADVAESTPYFRDALNDVLAGGKKIF